jgi:hypothetical protein
MRSVSAIPVFGLSEAAVPSCEVALRLTSRLTLMGPHNTALPLLGPVPFRTLASSEQFCVFFTQY